jgi:Family of unknown function (DUF6159)
MGWALVLTTVNLVIQALRERVGFLGNLLLGAAAVAWGLATFLVVPILALEGLGPLDALRRSTGLFREKWGEQLVGTASIGLVFGLLGTVPAVALVFLGIASGSTVVAVALVVVGVLIAVAAAVLGSAARSVFSVALYRYAAGHGATGRSPTPTCTTRSPVSASGRGSDRRGACVGRPELREPLHQPRGHSLRRRRPHVDAERLLEAIAPTAVVAAVQV